MGDVEEEAVGIQQEVGIVGEYASKCGGLLVVTAKILPHLRAHPEVTKELLTTSISQVEFPQNGLKKFITEIDLGRVIGKGNLVSAPRIEPTTRALFAYRNGRRTASRVIASDGVERPDVTTLSIFAHEGEDEVDSGKRRFYLRTCYVGKVVQKEPGDAVLRSGSKEEGKAIAFWCEHALIYEKELMGPVFESTWQDIVSEKRKKPSQKCRKTKKGEDKSEGDPESGSEGEEAELEDIETQTTQNSASDMIEEPNVELGNSGLKVADFEGKTAFVIHHVRGWDSILKAEIYENTNTGGQTSVNMANKWERKRLKEKMKESVEDESSVCIRRKKGYSDVFVVTTPQEVVSRLYGITTFESMKICVALISGIFPPESEPQSGNNTNTNTNNNNNNKKGKGSNEKKAIDANVGTYTTASSTEITTTSTSYSTTITTTTTSTSITTEINDTTPTITIEEQFTQLPFTIPLNMWALAITAWQQFQKWRSTSPNGKCSCTPSQPSDSSQSLQRITANNNLFSSNPALCPVCGATIKFRVSAKGPIQKLASQFAAGAEKLFGWEPVLQGYSLEIQLHQHKHLLFVHINLDFLDAGEATSKLPATQASKYETLLHRSIVYGMLRLTNPPPNSVILDPFPAPSNPVLRCAKRYDPAIHVWIVNKDTETSGGDYVSVNMENDRLSLEDASVDTVITKLPMDPNPARLRAILHELARVIKKGSGKIALMSVERRVVFQECTHSKWNLLWNHKLQVDGVELAMHSTTTLRFDQKVTLQEVIAENEHICVSFVEYLASIHAVEAFEFWVEVELYKRITDVDEGTRAAKFIFSTYLNQHSPSEINLEGKLRRELVENFCKCPHDPHLFDKAQDSVEMMLKYDCLRVFLEVNKGRVIRRSQEGHITKKKDPKLESHLILLHRYNTLVKQEKKKAHRKLTGEQPKSLSGTIKSNSFSLGSTDSRLDEVEGAISGKSSSADDIGKVPTLKRARGKKVRLDGKRWAVAVSTTPTTLEPLCNDGDSKTVEEEIAEVKDEINKRSSKEKKSTPESSHQGEKWLDYRKTPTAEMVAANTPTKCENEEQPAAKKQIEKSIEAISIPKIRSEGIDASQDGLIGTPKKEKEAPAAADDKIEKKRKSGGLFNCFGGGNSKKKP